MDPALVDPADADADDAADTRADAGASVSAVTREMQGEATRTRLVDLAVAALERGGEQAVKIRDVAGAVGLSVGAVYHHFESREELIVAARLAQFEGALAGGVAAIRGAVEQASTVDELRQAMRQLNRIAHAADRAPFRRLRAEVVGVARHNTGLAAALSEVQQARTAEMVEVVLLARDKGLGNPDLDPVAAATFLQAVTLGMVLDDVNLASPMDREAWHRLTDHVYEALLAPD